MNRNENIHLKVHQLCPEGIYTTLVFEIDAENQIVSNTYINISEENHFDYLNWTMEEDDSKLHLKHLSIKEEDPTVTLLKIEATDDQINSEAVMNSIVTLTAEDNYVFTPTYRQQNYHLKLPDATVISCQNCDTTFPTKYQYQRHQCEFNADKVVLKPEVIGKDIDKATRLRFECDTCKKSFVSNNNLERHKSCHFTNKLNVCEYCKKAFVSENRLKIHKENHCKKAGDMTKFYRSDVVVWHCENCKQVFATQQNGTKHIHNCTIMLKDYSNVEEKPDNILVEQSGSENVQQIGEMIPNKNNNFDANFEMAMNNQTEGDCEIPTIAVEYCVPKLSKVVTEILYQCEFCNQTYITKSTLLEHQGTHTTERNYECTFCNNHFNSYADATAHWQNKCTEESNLFYLPKMIYCEHCDRGFKSHEILYNHKNKKRHFTPKIHKKKIIEDNDVRNENAIVKLIESMITKMDKQVSGQNEDGIETCDVKIKTEEKENDGETSKRKRGRKRKWHKFELKNKKREDMINEGYMYQCERCSVVFKDLDSLDAHKNTQHTSIYSCTQCGQVVHSSKALVIHSRAHQSLKPYVCDQCGRSYSQTSHLWQHMRFHQDCNACEECLKDSANSKT